VRRFKNGCLCVPHFALSAFFAKCHDHIRYFDRRWERLGAREVDFRGDHDRIEGRARRRKIPAATAKNSAPPCAIDSTREPVFV
jgi:hypothetical protein